MEAFFRVIVQPDSNQTTLNLVSACDFLIGSVKWGGITNVFARFRHKGSAHGLAIG